MKNKRIDNSVTVGNIYRLPLFRGDFIIRVTSEMNDEGFYEVTTLHSDDEDDRYLIGISHSAMEGAEKLEFYEE